MSDLIAVAYPDRETAEAVRQKLAKLTLEHTIELEDAVIVDRDESGRVEVAPGAQSVRPRRGRRCLRGRPDRAAVSRAAVRDAHRCGRRGASGALVDVGINDQFMKDLGAKLKPEERP